MAQKYNLFPNKKTAYSKNRDAQFFIFA